MAAVVALAATPAQVGVLAAMSLGPSVLVGLFGGGLIDRNRRRPILIGSDLARAVVLGSVPLAAVLHLLGMAHIYIAAALVGAFSVAFNIADHAYLPGLVARDQLVEGNAKLAATESVAEIGGPAVAGVLFKVFTAPMALAANAATYLVSAVFLMAIRTPEPLPAPAGPPDHVLADFTAGLAIAAPHPLVRPLLLMSTAAAFFGSFYSALYTLYGIRTLGLSTQMLGLTIAVGGVGALIGAALARPVIQRFGIGPALVFSWLATSAASLLIPFAWGGPVTAMLCLMLAQLLGDSLGTVSEIASRTLRQSSLPPEVMGRVGAVFAVGGGVTGVIGALLGGWLGLTLGPRQALMVASAGLIVAPLIGLFSPLLRQREVPADIG
jgi:MFS family permease